MPATWLDDSEWDAIYDRAVNGESVTSLGREIGLATVNVSRMLKRRYGFTPTLAWFRPQGIIIPDDPTVLAYTAGLMDADGSILRRSDGIWVVKLGQTYPQTVHWFHKLYGGSMGLQTRRLPARDLHHWTLAAQLDVAALLTALLPYLQRKKARARQAIREISRRPVRRPVSAYPRPGQR